jgi:hypothetical protein
VNAATANATADVLIQTIEAADIDPQIKRKILRAIAPGDVKVVITEYLMGFVPNSYGYPKMGSSLITTISNGWISSAGDDYDMRRSGGKGSKVVVRIAKAGQKLGRCI